VADEKQKRMAIARLRGFRSHVTGQITQAIVNEYHSILHELEKASGEFLQLYSIPPSVMLPRRLGEQRKTHPFSISPSQFTAAKYCDLQFFKARIDLLWNHFEKGPIASRVEPTS
jgi:hypothetical protein